MWQIDNRTPFAAERTWTRGRDGAEIWLVAVKCTFSVLPDGSTAAEADMVAAMQTLKRFDTDVNTYVKCLEFEAKQNRLSREEQARKHNQAMDSLTQIAAKFNEQVRLFKAKSG